MPQVVMPGRSAYRRVGIERALGHAPVLCILLALAGCAVGPQFEKPDVVLNENWTAKDDSTVSTGTAPDATWWKAFNDPTLDSLIEMAYRQNLPLQVAGLRILEARAQLGLAVGEKYPQLQVAFGTATASRVSKYAANSAFANRDYWDYQLGFDAIWELDVWGKFSNNERAETANYFASIATYDDALVSLTAEVARSYAVIRTFEVLLGNARANVAVQLEGQRIAESRFRNGATSELDLMQATALLESTRTTIPQLESALTQSENALSTLLGQPTGRIRALLAPSQGIPAAPGTMAVSVPAELIRRRPDIRAVELAAIAQSARIGIAKADLYPSFVLAGMIGTQTSSGAGAESNGASFGDIFSADSFIYSFGPRLIYNFFNYGRTRNRVRIQDARFQQSLVDYENTVLKAAQEVEDGLTGVLKAREATVFAQNAVDAAQRSVDLAFVQYRDGAVDFQRVLEAQRSLLQEQNSAAQTRSSMATNLIALYKALGGGWEIRQGQPFVPESTRTQMQDRTNWGDYFEKPPSQQSPTESSPTTR